MFRTTQKETAADDIVDQIQSRIAGGQLNEGDRLASERALAQTFAVSRTTVREAMRTLVSMGLLETRPGSGIYVRRAPGQSISRSLRMWLTLEQTSVSEVLEVRSVVERHLAARAARHSSPEMIAELEAALTAIELANDEQSVFLAAEHFHVRLAELAGNRFLAVLSAFLIDLLLDAQRVAFRGSSGAYWVSRFRRTQRHRRALVRALKHGDPHEAKRLMSTYHDQLRRDFWKSDDQPIVPVHRQ